MEMKKIKSLKAAQWPIRPGGTVCEDGGGGALQIRTSRCLRLGSRAQTSEFCFKSLTNPSSKRVQLLPSHDNKDSTTKPYGEAELSLMEESERHEAHAVTTVGICTGEITKGRPTPCVPSASLCCHIVVFVALGCELPLPLSLPHPERDGSGKVCTAYTAS